MKRTIINIIFWALIFQGVFYMGYLSGKRVGKVIGYEEATEVFEERLCHAFFDTLPYTEVSADCYKYFKIGKTI